VPSRASRLHQGQAMNWVSLAMAWVLGFGPISPLRTARRDAHPADRRMPWTKARWVFGFFRHTFDGTLDPLPSLMFSSKPHVTDTNQCPASLDQRVAGGCQAIGLLLGSPFLNGPRKGTIRKPSPARKRSHRAGFGRAMHDVKAASIDLRRPLHAKVWARTCEKKCSPP
jgi:hypothetical protein